MSAMLILFDLFSLFLVFKNYKTKLSIAYATADTCFSRDVDDIPSIEEIILKAKKELQYNLCGKENNNYIEGIV